MARHLETTIDTFPIAGTFTISRGSKTQAQVVACVIRDGGDTGRGECVPYGRYGESIDSVAAQIAEIAPAIEAGLDRIGLQSAMPAGAARNAVDCALWDLEAKLDKRSVAAVLGLPPMRPLVTAYTISLGEPEVMAEQARKVAHRRLLKVKVGTGDDESRIRAVRAAAPESEIILDANEGWSDETIRHHLAIARQARIAVIEQPLPAGRDAILATIERPVPVCADESVHLTADLAALRDRYDAINIKLDKTGGLTEAWAMRQEAKRLGFRIMVGCMVGSSLAMAPALLVAQDADFVDLDGPLLLAEDRHPGLNYEGSLVYPPEASLWG
ncbi:dipeptide epimerase [Rhizobium sp. YJ-22]|uniref:N-acetyl-D-Glu racemase DgcA n=1 Tax=Rhizobium sp. YJ-22 TaxID=3037556 RepID=UPI002412BA7B|nr:N-acetyl-D-Glu racemase DgcA [Rhizobium sp. YJ-22]MDG3578539.1 dipeptide epimerase [Rhizobium sp. YJ-22]